MNIKHSPISKPKNPQTHRAPKNKAERFFAWQRSSAEESAAFKVVFLAPLGRRESGEPKMSSKLHWHPGFPRCFIFSCGRIYACYSIWNSTLMNRNVKSSTAEICSSCLFLVGCNLLVVVVVLGCYLLCFFLSLVICWWLVIGVWSGEFSCCSTFHRGIQQGYDCHHHKPCKNYEKPWENYETENNKASIGVSVCAVFDVFCSHRWSVSVFGNIPYH